MSRGSGNPLYKEINDGPAPQRIATEAMFAKAASPELSPVDEFLANATAINVLAFKSDTVTSTMASLTVLGYVSAVESYFRTLTRRLIVIDRDVRRKFEQSSLTYAAVLYHRREMLPDALLEGTVFSDSAQVTELYRKLSRSNRVAKGIEAALENYRKICTIRHCCVHRFGRLGIKNAVDLGLDAHRHVLDHAFTPKIEDLEAISFAAHNLVLEFNRTVFGETLDRLADPRKGMGADWTWRLNSDKRKFALYYDVFAIREAGKHKSPNLEDVYSSYRKERRPGRDAMKIIADRRSDEDVAMRR